MARSQIPMRPRLRKRAADCVGSIVIVVSALMSCAQCARSEPPRPVSADLAFNFVCKQNEQTTIDEKIEKFLNEKGFSILNQARVNRQRGAPSFGLLILGLDGARRIITFNALPPREGRYAASLLSPPPTQRSAMLEDALLQFVTNQVGCEVYQITRQSNGADAIDAYERHFKVIEDLFRDAEKMRGRRQL